ncbi:hypothetical protein AMTR_s00010p00260360 [Amborella trichopoda]|uniref:Glutathione S-transferase n=1 Tax=Amborella trichopoda TaxID=13333 RepID=W1NG49_AMBTC|nr:hypothetical protein AMTR_s00010p00260360 [Amborella trichopoda]
MANSEVKLFGLWASSFCHRVELALKLKGISYEYIEEELNNKSPLLLQLNPIHKKVPVLLHSGRPIAESLIILEYIDETWPELSALMPEDPYERALVRFWADFLDKKFLETSEEILRTEGKEQEKAVAEYRENLEVLEKGLQRDFGTKKPFINGETPGYLDVILASSSGWMKGLEEIAGQKFIEEEKAPLMHSFMSALCDLGVVRETIPSPDNLLLYIKNKREKALESAKKEA